MHDLLRSVISSQCVVAGWDKNLSFPASGCSAQRNARHRNQKNKTGSCRLPALPPAVGNSAEMPVAPAAPKFDIIMGDELTQDSKESAKEAAKAPANSALPAIPSGNAAPKASVPSPVQNTPFEGSPIMKKIGN